MAAQQEAAEKEEWGENLLSAHSAGDAVKVLAKGVGGETDADRHPEKRLKAAYAAYEVGGTSVTCISYYCVVVVIGCVVLLLVHDLAVG